jgi:hypothetical protein
VAAPSRSEYWAKRGKQREKKPVVLMTFCEGGPRTPVFGNFEPATPVVLKPLCRRRHDKFELKPKQSQNNQNESSFAP